MTTGRRNAPTFYSPRGHPALRAAVIIGLCASLLAGFLATSSQLGVPSSTRTDAASVACDAAAVGHAC